MLRIDEELGDGVSGCRRGVGQRAGMIDRLAHRVARCRRAEVDLSRVVMLERAARDAGARGDPAGAEPGVADLDEKLDRGRQDSRLGLEATLLLGSPHLLLAVTYHRQCLWTEIKRPMYSSACPPVNRASPPARDAPRN